MLKLIQTTNIRVGILLCILLWGCATPERDVPIDPRCIRVSKYVAGISNLRDSGIKPGDVYNFIPVPSVQDFPIQLINRDLYNSQSPAKEASEKHLTSCIGLGYTGYIESFYPKETPEQELSLTLTPELTTPVKEKAPACKINCQKQKK